MPATVVVTITGSGDSEYCYATINGTEQYSAGTHEIYTRDTIMFGVGSSSSWSYGSVTIDGIRMLQVTSGSKTYDWTVPNGISTVKIEMKIVQFTSAVYGTITVTTA